MLGISGENENPAVGLGTTFIRLFHTLDTLQPIGEVSSRDTVYVPISVKRFEGLNSLAVLPSPKSQLNK